MVQLGLCDDREQGDLLLSALVSKSENKSENLIRHQLPLASNLSLEASANPRKTKQNKTKNPNQNSNMYCYSVPKLVFDSLSSVFGPNQLWTLGASGLMTANRCLSRIFHHELRCACATLSRGEN